MSTKTNKNLDLNISIVTYQNNLDLLRKTILSCLNCSLFFKIYLIDNSPKNKIQSFAREFEDSRINYVFNNQNLGFGKAHNLAIKKELDFAKYHLVLNPDVYFEKETLEKIFYFMEENPQVGQIMPKVLYPDQSLQYLCKLLPSPADLFTRRFLSKLPWGFVKNFLKQQKQAYELRDSNYQKIINVPYLSGCFMFLRNSVLKEIGLFDPKIFMYIEDADLTRRIHRKYQTLFFPKAQIIHQYQKGSYKSLKLMLFNIHGAFVYFNKYGWFFDEERKKINTQTLSQLKN